MCASLVASSFSMHQQEMHPVVVLLALQIWALVWGMTGAILSVPLTGIIKIVLEHMQVWPELVATIDGSLFEAPSHLRWSHENEQLDPPGHQSNEAVANNDADDVVDGIHFRKRTEEHKEEHKEEQGRERQDKRRSDAIHKVHKNTGMHVELEMTRSITAAVPSAGTAAAAAPPNTDIPSPMSGGWDVPGSTF